MRPEYLNLYEFEVLESLLKDLDADGQLKPSEKEILVKIARITEYIRARRAQKKSELLSEHTEQIN